MVAMEKKPLYSNPCTPKKTTIAFGFYIVILLLVIPAFQMKADIYEGISIKVNARTAVYMTLDECWIQQKIRNKQKMEEGKNQISAIISDYKQWYSSGGLHTNVLQEVLPQ
jgi:hypothetical protein